MLVLLLLSCSAPPKEQDAKTDSVTKPTESTANQYTTVIAEPQTKVIEVSGKHSILDSIVYLEWPTLLTLPDIFEFSVCNDQYSLAETLGKEALFRNEDFPGGEDYNAYTVCYLTFRNSELMEYSYGGMHNAFIDTPLLPLREGIEVGMTKAEFSEKFKLPALDQNVFSIYDDYGSVKFRFGNDTLRVVAFYYEYGT